MSLSIELYCFSIAVCVCEITPLVIDTIRQTVFSYSFLSCRQQAEPSCKILIGCISTLFLVIFTFSLQLLNKVIAFELFD